MRARRAGLFAAEALMSDRRGRVVSVHSRAIHLLLDDGPLVAVLPERTPLHPWALRVSLAAPLLARVAEGAVVSVTGHSLAIGSLKISLEGLSVMDLRIAWRPHVIPAGAVRTLGRLMPAPGNGTTFAPTLAEALEKFRAGGDARALAALVGVGEGLTPSGDDVIVGALAGLDFGGDAVAKLATARRRLCSALLAGGARTTRLSAQLLEAAAEGHYPEPLLDLLGALIAVQPSIARLRRRVSGLLAIGHRSGADMLRGLVAALECTHRGTGDKPRRGR